tara:strand:+ start:106 stop:297 length:192 start_codon:yes stop_codon:yes gene_type:complete
MNKIDDILKEKGISQTWLSKKIGKGYNMTNSYCRNRRQPSIEILFKISKVLNVKPSELINDNF